jgi:hypothetical protein
MVSTIQGMIGPGRAALIQAIAEEWRSGDDVLGSIGCRKPVFGDFACNSVAVGLSTHGPAAAVRNYLDFRSREQRLSLPGRRHRFGRHGRRFALAMLHALEQGFDIRSAIKLAGIERNWALRRYYARGQSTPPGKERTHSRARPRLSACSVWIPT